MADLAKIKKKIKKTQDLSSVVNTMKSIAAVNIRHFEKAALSVRDYYRSVELGLQILIKNHPQIFEVMQIKGTSFRTGAVVIGSERGMCGEFNDRMEKYFRNILQEEKIDLQNLHILSIGEHITYRMENYPNIRTYLFPATFSKIGELIWQMLQAISTWRMEYGIEKIYLFFNRMVSGSTYEPDMIQVLPLSLRWLEELYQRKWESSTIPTFTISWQELFGELLQEYIYISIYRGFAESLASENASRLTAMQAAQQNIEEHQKELEKNYHQQRQNFITEELFDIISGFEILRE